MDYLERETARKGGVLMDTVTIVRAVAGVLAFGVVGLIFYRRKQKSA
jgi:hypothetical protein